MAAQTHDPQPTTMLVQPSQHAAANGDGMPLYDRKDDCMYPTDLLSPTLLSKNCQSTFVTPSVPLTPEWVKLPALDQVENRVIIPAVLIFQMPLPALRQPLLRDLKTSLANTIGELSFLAADVVPDCEEQGSIQLEISDGAGVWFHSQELPEIDYHALERRRFPCSAFPFLSSVVPEPRLHRSQRTPVLTVLATFITGGLLLALNNHHSVTDGTGMKPFIKTFAKHLAALSEGRFVSSEDVFPEEALDRSNIFRGGGRKQLCDIPNYRVSENYRFARENSLLEAIVARDEQLQLLQKLQLSHWVVSGKSLLALREAASPLHETEGSTVLTNHAILCAALWRHISRARQLSSLGITTNSFISTVNVRRRMDPPLPLEYAGNALVHAKTSAAVSDVVSAEPGTLYMLARQITHAIEWWTSERIWELIGAIESSAMISKIEPDMDNFQGPDLEVSNTATIGDVLELDWGCRLGKVKAIRFAYAPVKDGWVNVLPQKKGDDLELLIALEKDVIKRLGQDKEWLQFAQESL
ncbi:transferase family protein [Hirsutella rhossiliensis]|uniref:Transferase family domain-containing protein n=1 Tax=Hirsutella rhossiliensis TaxID=111463 RepID=A0A9P8N3V9_9HYPO|nr:transferase family domain-containing protein [Hirsutella rhossiliensis]KAH0966339.1 transferase family domain-containing protein [Hirsutella rhossiliensis]